MQDAIQATTSTTIETGLRQQLIKCLVGIKNLLPIIYEEAKAFLIAEEQLCKVIIPNNIERVIRENADEDQLRFWFGFADYVLRILQGIRERTKNPDSVFSFAFKLEELIKSLSQLCEKINPQKIVVPATQKIREQERAMVEEQRSLNRKPQVTSFTSALMRVRNKAAEIGLNAKRLYFSYAWPESDEHQESWTENFIYVLAENLRMAGFSVTVDQMQSCAGVDMLQFMIKSIAMADSILVICDRTLEYKFVERGNTGVVFEYLEIIKRWQLEKERGIDSKRLAIPICLSKNSYMPGLIAKRSEVSFYKGYENALKELIFRLYEFSHRDEFNNIWAGINEAVVLTPSLFNTALVKTSQPTYATSLAVTAASLPINDTAHRLRLGGAEAAPVVKKSEEKPKLDLSKLPGGTLTNVPKKFRFFQERTELLLEITSKMRQHNVVIAGMAGAGKTQLALRYGEEFNKTHHQCIVYKLFAESVESFQQECRHFAIQLQLLCLNITTRSEMSFEETLLFIRDVMLNNDVAMLLIIDNADLPEVKNVVKEFAEKCPHQPNKQILITSQDQHFYNDARVVSMARFPINSLSLLKDILATIQLIDEDTAALETLADRLGNLPLAIATAAYYKLRNSNTTLNDYLLMLDDGEVLKRIGAQENCLPHDYQTKPLAYRNQRSAILLSLTNCNDRWNQDKGKEDQLSDLIVKYVRYFVFLEGIKISNDILVDILVHHYHWSSTYAMLIVNDALNALEAFSLIQRLNGAVSLHTIEQEAIALTLSAQERINHLSILLEILVAKTSYLLEKKAENIANLMSYTRQLKRVYQHAKALNIKPTLMLAEAGCLLGDAYILFSGDMNIYLAYFLQAEKDVRALSETSLEHKQLLARALRGQGWAYANKDESDAVRAVELYSQALACEVVGTLGYAETQSGLGIAYRTAGQPDKAVKAHQEALATKEQLSMVPPESVYDSYRSLGTAYRDLAKKKREHEQDACFVESSKCYQRALYGFVSRYPDILQQDVAHSIGNLGTLYARRKQFAMALKFHTAALLLRNAIFTLAHPHTCWTLNALAMVYAGQGNYTQAVALMKTSKNIMLEKEGKTGATAKEALDKLNEWATHRANLDKKLIKDAKQALVTNKYVFLLERANKAVAVKLLTRANVSEQISLKLLQRVKPIASDIFKSAHYEKYRLELSPEREKCLFLAGTNFIEENDDALFNLTPRLFIAEKLCLEERWIEITHQTVFNLLRVLSEDVIKSLLQATHEKWLQEILKSEIIQAFVAQSGKAPSRLQNDCELYKRKRNEVRELENKLLTIPNADANMRGELALLRRQFVNLESKLLTACAEKEICDYYVNNIVTLFQPGSQLLLAYARLDTQVNVLIFIRDNRQIAPVLKDHVIHDATTVPLLLMIDEDSVTNLALLDEPYFCKDKQQNSWLSYLNLLVIPATSLRPK